MKSPIRQKVLCTKVCAVTKKIVMIMTVMELQLWFEVNWLKVEGRSALSAHSVVCRMGRRPLWAKQQQHINKGDGTFVKAGIIGDNFH